MSKEKIRPSLEYSNKVLKKVNKATENLIKFAMVVISQRSELNEIEGCGHRLIELLIEGVLGRQEDHDFRKGGEEYFSKQNLIKKLKKMPLEDKMQVSQRIVGALLALNYKKTGGAIQEYNTAAAVLEEYYANRNRRISQ